MRRSSVFSSNSKPAVLRRPVAVLSSLLLAVGVLAALPVTPFGGAQQARAATAPWDVVFVQNEPGDNPYRIERYHVLDDTFTNLSTGGPGNDFMPVVSPDGSKIAFIGERPGPALVVMNSDGSGQTTLVSPRTTVPTLEVSMPAWSPDGSKIAYDEYVNDGQSNASYIAVINADGTGYQRLTSGGHETSPSWSPTKVNGHYQITYEKDDPATLAGQIMVMQDDGTNQRPASTDGATALAPQWSPDGNRIYFIGGDGFEYYTSNDSFTTPSGSPSLLSSTSGGATVGGNYRFEISPDGNYLTYARPDSSGCTQIYTMSTTTTATTQLTDTGCNEQNWAPTFAPATSSPPPPASFTVQIDDSSVGTVFLSSKKVLDSSVSPPNAACGSQWEISTTNNTAFVLAMTTEGVVGSQVGQSSDTYLVPGQQVSYCVAFTKLNQIFSVSYDMSNSLASAADVGLFLDELIGLPTDDTIALSNFVSRVASIPEIKSIGACLGNLKPSCGIQAVNALMKDKGSKGELLSALSDYVKELGQGLSQKFTDKWLEKQHLGEKLLSIFTTIGWLANFTGQEATSPSGFVAFETAPISGAGGGGVGGF